MPMKVEQTECSETSAHKIQTPGNYPEENTQQTIYPLNKRLCGLHSRFGQYHYAVFSILYRSVQFGIYLLPAVVLSVLT